MAGQVEDELYSDLGARRWVGMVAQISDDEDKEAKAVYNWLLHHQIEPQLRIMDHTLTGDTLTGNAGILMNKL